MAEWADPTFDFDILDEKMLSQTAKLDEAINLYKFQESLDTEGFKKTLQNNANVFLRLVVNLVIEEIQKLRPNSVSINQFKLLTQFAIDRKTLVFVKSLKPPPQLG